MLIKEIFLRLSVQHFLDSILMTDVLVKHSIQNTGEYDFASKFQRQHSQGLCTDETELQPLI